MLLRAREYQIVRADASAANRLISAIAATSKTKLST
jgi:hypothetical protein